MTPDFETEAACLFEDARAHDLAQFEPDPEGRDDIGEPLTAGADDLDDAQWVVWPDAVEESLWVGFALRLYGSGLP